MSSSYFAARIESENQTHDVIRCADLDCHNCAFRFNDTEPFKNRSGERDDDGRFYMPTGVCAIYDVKPDEVLCGEKCKEKVAE